MTGLSTRCAVLRTSFCFEVWLTQSLGYRGHGTACAAFPSTALISTLWIVKERQPISRSNRKARQVRAFRFTAEQWIGGGERDRTDDPLLAKQVLSQLSYTPTGLVGLVGFEPTTPALSRRCSNRLSYRPAKLKQSGAVCRQQQPISVGA